MKSGTYWEYICVECGWFPQWECTDENSDSVKERALSAVNFHRKEKHKQDAIKKNAPHKDA